MMKIDRFIFSDDIPKLRVNFILVFVFLSISSYFILNYFFSQSEKSYLDRASLTYQRSYNTIFEQYKELSEVVYTGLLKLGYIDDRLEGIEKKTTYSQSLIRRSLYFQTIKRFNSLKTKHITNISFILPSSKVFLSMKTPMKFGQKVNGDLINYVSKYKKPFFSYEIRNSSAGFRFIYPVLNQNKFLGIVCITFGEEAFTSSIMKQYYVLSNFIIDDTNFDKEFLEKSKVYTEAHLKGFLHSRAVLKELKKVARKDITKIKPSIETTKRLYSNGMQDKTMSLYREDSNTIVTTIPVIQQITKKQEAFIAVLSKGDEIKELYRNKLIILLLLIFLFANILMMIYQINIKRILEKDNLKKMMEKDKQLFEQAKMAQMGEMIGNIAHQWRQPLNAISTVASGVKLNQEFGVLDENELKGNMDTIVDTTKYLSNTIDTFRDFIKEEKTKKEFLIKDKIEESVKIVESSMASHYIKLTKKLKDKEHISANIVGDELVQVIINLLNNSKDAIVQNSIKEAIIEIGLEEDEKNIFIYVSDNAGGIDKDILPKIFDPYFTTKHKYQGTGLGLYMSKTIIEKHFYGKLYVSNTDIGAKFTIEIPKSKVV